MSFQTPQVGGLQVTDEGVTILNPAQSMDFTGAGVTAIDGGGGKATVTIPGGGAVNTFVYSETPTDNADGTYTIAHTPVAGTLVVYKNGQRMRSGAGNDYTFSGTTITRLDAYSANDVWLVDYQY